MVLCHDHGIVIMNPMYMHYVMTLYMWHCALVCSGSESASHGAHVHAPSVRHNHMLLAARSGAANRGCGPVSWCALIGFKGRFECANLKRTKPNQRI